MTPAAVRPSAAGARYHWGALVGGGLLAAAGLRSRSALGVPLAIAGAALLYRGARESPVPTPGLRPRAAAPVDVSTSVTVRGGPAALYARWRDFRNLPQFMRHLHSVEPLGPDRYRFEARLPGLDTPLSWDADVVEDKPGQCIRWSTPPDSALMHRGMVTFLPAPGGRGTEVHLCLAYRPGSATLTAVTRLLGTVNAQVIKEELRRFKQWMETGEVPTIEGQPSG
ncbi:MAG: SRPBCC family protein [Gammaproteobacteria bacterium]|nr:SRPBCC family protein [Gammaproteobacteria bacterium]